MLEDHHFSNFLMIVSGPVDFLIFHYGDHIFQLFCREKVELSVEAQF